MADNYTLTYSESSKGFPSFYSYVPEWMLGMNNYFYSFKNGNIYRHNVNETRNNFYESQYNSTISSVFNQNPLENKIFKTLNLESNSAWTATLRSDIETSGFIEKTYFVKKEGAWFAFVRNSGQIPAGDDEFVLRSVNGIGQSQTITGTSAAPQINFSTSPLVSIGSIISVGDVVYFAQPPYTVPQLAGTVTSINVDLQNLTNNIILDATTAGAVSPIPIQNPYIMFVKNAVAESHGILGHYCDFTLTNTDTSAAELFAVESEVMKSYP
jgi:hypothetical protein